MGRAKIFSPTQEGIHDETDSQKTPEILETTLQPATKQPSEQKLKKRGFFCGCSCGYTEDVVKTKERLEVE